MDIVARYFEENQLLFKQIHLLQEFLEDNEKEENFEYYGISYNPELIDKVKELYIYKNKIDDELEFRKKAMQVLISSNLRYKNKKGFNFSIFPYNKKDVIAKLIKLSNEKSSEETRKELLNLKISDSAKAVICTEIAREFQKKYPEKACEFANLAWEMDPKPFRLKWLAFREYDADKITKAYAILALLGKDVTLTKSEQTKVELIEKDANNYYKNIAEKKFINLKENIKSRNLNSDFLFKEIQRLKYHIKEESKNHFKIIENLKSKSSGKEFFELQILMGKSNEKIEDLNKVLIQRDKELKNRASIIEQNQNNIKILKSDNELLREDKKNLELKVDEFVEICKKSKQKIEDYKLMIANRDEDWRAQDNIIKKLNIDLENFRSENELYKNTIKELEFKVEELDKVEEKLKQKIEDYKLMIANRDEEWRAQDNIIKKLNSDLENFRSENELYKNTIKELDDRVKNITIENNKLKAFEADFELKIQESEEKEKAFYREKAELDDLYKNKSLEVETLLIEKKEIKEEIDKKDKIIEKFAENYEKLNKLIREEKSKSINFESTINAFNLRCTELVNEKNVIFNELNSYKDKYQNTIIEKKVLEEKVDNINSIHEEMNECYNGLCKQLSITLEGMDQKFKNLEENNVVMRRIEVEKGIMRFLSYEKIRNFLENGKFDSFIPWAGGWPASPDFILLMMELLVSNSYELIIEFGSGFTTLYCAKTLKKMGSIENCKFVSFEHLDKYYKETSNLLRLSGFKEEVDLNLLPLKEYKSPFGEEFLYYSCEEKLSEVCKIKKWNNILVIVDGPPQKTCKNARFPALPIVLHNFYPANIDFLMDDCNRTEESDIINMWKAICDTAGIENNLEKRNLEKGAALMQIRC